MNRKTLLLFFLSGATSLVYEVVWMRRLSLVFGHSIFSVSTVLTAFMAGLALGSYLGGRWSDRKRGGGSAPGDFIKSYGRLEIFIGLWALLSLVLLNGIEGAFLSMSQSGTSAQALQVFIFVGSVLVLLPPTTAMGATLPVFTQALVLRQQDTGAHLSKIYGLNTLGACLGAASGGLLLLPSLGLLLTVLATAVVNMVIAALAFTLAKGMGGAVAPAEPTPAAPEQQSSPGGSALVPFVFGLSGFAGMVYQIGWTRALVLSIGSSTYSFSIILTTFLAALGLGSIIYRRLFGHRPPQIRDLILIQLTIAASSLVVTLGMGRLPMLKLKTLPSLQHSFAAVASFDTLVVFLLLLLPALALGLTFPLVTHLYTSRLEELGRRLGEAYSANTTGAIFGSFLGGFVLLPTLGLQHTIEFAAVLNLLGGLLLIPAQIKKSAGRPEIGLVLMTVGLLLFAPAWDLGLMSSGAGIGYQGRHIRPAPIFYRDGVTSTVTVGLNSGLHPYIAVNGKTDASLTPADRRTQLLLGLVPAALHPNPEQVAVIGFGSGQTSVGLLAVEEVKHLRCAELEPAVLEAKKFFSPFSEGLLEDPRLELVEDDGRSFIMGSPIKFDVIVSEPSNPWIAGIGNLYTKDFYEGCRAQLEEGGIMGQWFHLYAMSEQDIQMVYRTFFSAFPEGALYRTGPGDILLIGAEKPPVMEQARLEQLFSTETSARWLRSLGLAEPNQLYGTYLASRGEVLAYLEAKGPGLAGPINTDDLPLLEFQAPLSLYSQHGVVSEAYSSFPSLVPPNVEGNTEVLAEAVLGRFLLELTFDPAAALVKLKAADPHWSALAVIDLLEGRVPAAVTAYADVSEPWGTLVAIGIKERVEDLSGLGELYQKSLGDPPTGGLFHLLMGAARVAIAEGRFPQAKALLEQALPLTKGDGPLLAQGTLGPLEEWNESSIRQALGRNPYSVVTHLKLASLLRSQKKDEEALKFALEGYRLFPHNLELVELLSELYRAAGDADAVLKYNNQLRVLRQIEKAKKGG